MSLPIFHLMNCTSRTASRGVPPASVTGDEMNDKGKEIGEEWQTSRRRFLAGTAALGLAGWTDTIFPLAMERAGWSGLPAKPTEQPLDFHTFADAFDDYVMDP